MAIKNRLERMRTILTDLSPEILDIKNQSHLHHGHAGDDGTGETHYALKIKSTELSEISRVKAHQRIMHLLKSEFETGLHALTIKILS